MHTFRCKSPEGTYTHRGLPPTHQGEPAEGAETLVIGAWLARGSNKVQHTLPRCALHTGCRPEPNWGWAGPETGFLLRELKRKTVMGTTDIQGPSVGTTTNGDGMIQRVKDEDVGGIKALIKLGADVNICDGKGATPLHWAAASGSVDVVATLVDFGADVRSVGSDAERTPALLWAAKNGHCDAISYMVRAGANVKAANNDGVCALHLAAGIGHVRAICKVNPKVLAYCTSFRVTVTPVPATGRGVIGQIQ
eukprot:1177121-Prorocentrum_minimum.AAC.3